MEFTKRTPKICKTCGREFLAKKSNAEFCSQAYRPSTKLLRMRPKSEMAPNKCGAHSELVACAYLLRQGYDVCEASASRLAEASRKTGSESKIRSGGLLYYASRPEIFGAYEGGHAYVISRYSNMRKPGGDLRISLRAGGRM